MKRLRCTLSGLLVAYFANPSSAITLQTSLQRTLENNPEIQKAKCNLEGAAGRRLVFHAVALPDAKIGVLGGVEGGQRAGQKAVQVFGFGYGGFHPPLFYIPAPSPSCAGGDAGRPPPQPNYVGAGGA